MDVGSPTVVPGLPAARPRWWRMPLGAVQNLMRDPFSATGIVIYLLFLIAALAAGSLAQYDPTEILMTDDGQLAAGLGPSAAHWLGTTSMGRDIFSQLILGARPSLFVGLTAAVGVTTLGTIVGLLAGYSAAGWTRC